MGQIRQVLSCQQTFRGVFYLWYLIRNYGYKTIKLQNLLFLWEVVVKVVTVVMGEGGEGGLLTLHFERSKGRVYQNWTSVNKGGRGSQILGILW